MNMFDKSHLIAKMAADAQLTFPSIRIDPFCCWAPPRSTPLACRLPGKMNWAHFFALVVVEQKQAMLVRQLEEELRMRSLQNPSHEVRHQVEAMYAENDHLSREVSILRETVKVFPSQENHFFTFSHFIK